MTLVRGEPPDGEAMAPNRAARRADQKARGAMPKRGNRHAFRMVRQIAKAMKEQAGGSGV